MTDSVQVKFGAETSGLTAGVDQVKDKLAQVGGAGDALADKLTGIASAIAGAFTADKIAGFVEGTAKAAEQIERLHNITGLSTDTIQTLQYAMQMAGGDADQAAMMMSRFERNIAEAASGTGTAYNAFTMLGISLQMLQHATPQEIFNKMADGFKNISDPAERADVAIALLGRSGAALVPVLSQGSAGLAQMAQRLDETHDRLDPGAVEAFAHLERSIIDMGKAFEGSMRTGLTPFVDLIDKAVQLVTKLTEGITNLGGSLLGMAKNAASLTQLLGMAATGNTGSASSLAGGPEYGSPIGPNKPAAKINRTSLSGSGSSSDDGDTEAKQRSLYAENYDVKKEYDALAVQSGQETHQQEMADLQAALAQEQNLVDKSFSDQLEEYDKDSSEYKNLMAEKQIADEKFQIEHMKLTQQATQDDAKQWTSAFDTIGKSMDTMLTGILQGTQTMTQVFQKFAQNMVITFIEAVAKILVENALLLAAQNMGWTQMTSALTKSLKDWVLVETQKTSATTTGNALRTASNTAAATAGDTANAAAASTAIAQDAAEAASATYAEVAQIPYVGWILAPPAAAVAFAAVMAYDSFDKGTDYVPNDMMAKIHKGERILTASENQALNTGQLNLGKAGNAGGGGVSLHVSAMDSASVGAAFQRNHAAIARALATAARGGNHALRSAFSRM